MEIATVEGPLERERLGWVADLYGRADPKYRRWDVLEHLYTQSPAGAGMHAFALDEGRAVGHCSVIPMWGRRGAERFRCGKLEALFFEAPYRGRREGAQTLARALLERLYAFAHERGVELLHAYATPAIARVIAFDPLAGAGERSFVAVTRADTRAALPQRAVSLALAAGQAAARAPAAALTRGGEILRPANADDVDLADGPLPPPGTWGVVAADAWDWHASSPLVRVLESPGSRALVQLPGSGGEPLRLIGWRAERPGLAEALRTVAATARLARRTGAPTLRFQPWGSDAGDGALARACRLLGLVRRDDFTTLWVHTARGGPARTDTVQPSPLLYLGF